jgi:hypothetical protein
MKQIPSEIAHVMKQSKSARCEEWISLMKIIGIRRKLLGLYVQIAPPSISIL